MTLSTLVFFAVALPCGVLLGTAFMVCSAYIFEWLFKVFDFAETTLDKLSDKRLVKKFNAEVNEAARQEHLSGNLKTYDNYDEMMRDIKQEE